MIGYSVNFALNTKMNNLFGAAKGGSGGDCKNDSGGGDGDVNSIAATMMERCFIIEKEDGDPDNAAFAGRFDGFLQSLMKSKKTMAGPFYWFKDLPECNKSSPPLPIIHPCLLLRTSDM